MSWDRGMWWPFGLLPQVPSGSTTLDATGEKVACIGRISIAGKATGKTLDTSGSSSIKFCVGSSPAFDNVASVFTVGFQGVDKTTGFPVRPDGTWGARAVITTVANSTPTLTTTANSHAVAPTLGSTTLNHGDEVAFVMEMTTRAGTDSVAPQIAGLAVASGVQYPATVTNVSGAWVGVTTALFGGLSFEVTFSDGTIGTIDSCVPGVVNILTWADATNPDEHGLVFQVPFACTVDALYFPLRIVDATSDLQFDLTSTPLGTPASLIGGPIAMTAENLAVAASENTLIYSLASEVSLSANTDYCLSVKATGAGNIRFAQLLMISAASRIFAGPAGTTMAATTRNGGSGAFAAVTTTTINPMSVRISSITAGSSGGGLRMAGHGGLAA